MAKVTDIQDKNGISKEIQDKDLANRTSQSTVASTDYILLEDTDGAYHKIAKASFTEAVRGALGSVINSVAKGTDIAKVPVLDSNNDLGMGTLANLASVLGGITKSMGANTDCNDMLDPSITYYWSANSPVHAPYSYGILKTLMRFGDCYLQICIIRNNDPQFSMRTFYNNAWTAWKLFSLTNLE